MQAVVGRRALKKQAASTNTLSRFETEVLVTQENQKGLEQLNAAWVDRAMMRTWHQRVIPDMDSSESPVYPVYGEQERAAYNGHFECVYYHPLFCFNQFGDREGAMSTALSVGGRPWSRLWSDIRRNGCICCSGLMLRAASGARLAGGLTTRPKGSYIVGTRDDEG